MVGYNHHPVFAFFISYIGMRGAGGSCDQLGCDCIVRIDIKQSERPVRVFDPLFEVVCMAERIGLMTMLVAMAVDLDDVVIIVILDYPVDVDAIIAGSHGFAGTVGTPRMP